MAPKQRYFGSWSELKDLLASFDGYYNSDRIPDEKRPTDRQILFAAYGGGGYDGSCTVILKNKDGLFEVYGSHCSCNGLEGQWNPQPVTWEALALRLPELRAGEYCSWRYNHDDKTTEAFIKLIESKNKKN